MTNEEIAEMADRISLIGRKGFMFCESASPRYEVRIKFDSLKEAHEFHEVLYRTINRSVVRECQELKPKG